MPNILDLSARLSADVKPFVNSMGDSANTSRSAFQNIAQAATMYLGARGLLGTLNRANEAAMSFGQSLADASAISTLSVKQLGDALMSLDNVFGRVSKASSSMYRILSSGFSQLDASQLLEFQKAVGVSSKVIRADLYSTADVMTTIANAYQLNIKQIEKLQDWFYITVREGKAQGQDLARTLGLVINSASEAGVSLNELGAAIAVLSRTQSASQSMIGLNQMLNAFIKPTLQAQAAARKWGIELNASAIQNKSLIEILTELNAKVGGNVEALEAMFGNIRAGRAILSITGKQFKNYNSILKMYETSAGSGMEAFKKQIDTVQNAYERLQAQQEKTLIQIGDDWGGVRKIIYNTGETLLKAFSDSSPVSRWGVYLYGIQLAGKNIIGVVNNLRNSVERVTTSVDRMSVSFGRAAMASHGISATGAGGGFSRTPYTPIPRTGPNFTPIGRNAIAAMGNAPYRLMYNSKGSMKGVWQDTSEVGSHIYDRLVSSEMQLIEKGAYRRAYKDVQGYIDSELNSLRKILFGGGKGNRRLDARRARRIDDQLYHSVWHYDAYAPILRRKGSSFNPMGNEEAMQYILKNTATVGHYTPWYKEARIKEINKLGVWGGKTPEQMLAQAQAYYKELHRDDVFTEVSLKEALRVMTGVGGKTNPLTGLYTKNMRNIPESYASGQLKAASNDPMAYIMQNTLSRDVEEHQIKAREIALKQVNAQFRKIADIKDDEGIVRDWKIADKNGRVFESYNQTVEDYVDKVFDNNVKFVQEATAKVKQAERNLDRGRAGRFDVKLAAEARMNQFYTKGKGERAGTVNKRYYGMTSKERLLEMQQSHLERQPHTLGNSIARSSIGRWWRGKLAEQPPVAELGFDKNGKLNSITPNQAQSANWVQIANKFGNNVGKQLSRFAGSIGDDMATIFTAISVAGLVESAAEIGWNIGKAIGEKLDLANTAAFDWLGRMIAYIETLGKVDITTSTRELELRNAKNNAGRSLDTFNMLYNQAKQAGIEEGKLADYQKSIYENFPITQTSEDLAKVTGSLETMNEVVNNLNKDLEEYHKRQGLRTDVEEAYRVMKQGGGNIRAEQEYIRNYVNREGVRIGKQERALYDAYLDDPDKMKQLLDFDSYIQKHGGDSVSNNLALLGYLKDMGIDTKGNGFEVGNAEKNLEALHDFSRIIGYMRGDKGVKKAVVEIERNQMLSYAGKRADKALSNFNKSSDKINANKRYNDITADYISNLEDLNDRGGINTATLKKAMGQASTSQEVLTSLMDARSEMLKEMNDTIAKTKEAKGRNLTSKEIDDIKQTFRERILSADEAIVDAQKDVLRDKTHLYRVREKGFSNFTDTQIKQLKAGITGETDPQDAVSNYYGALKVVETKGRNWGYQMPEEEIKDAQEKVRNAFVTQLDKLLDNSDELSDIAARASGSMLSEQAVEDAQMEIFKREVDIINSVLEKLDPTKDEELYSKYSKQRDSAVTNYNNTLYKKFKRSVTEELADTSDSIELDSLRKRITERQANLRKMEAYKKAIKRIETRLKGVNKDSEVGRELIAQRTSYLRELYQLRNTLHDNVNEAREQLMNTLSGIINGNMENGRLNNVGMHHAMNLLARMSHRFKYDVGGASLNDVITNARAKYSGSTPDVSKAMTQQRRLSDMMDAYIVSKQYEDAGIGKNVQTIVTIMGKRLPLFLN